MVVTNTKKTENASRMNESSSRNDAKNVISSPFVSNFFLAEDKRVQFISSEGELLFLYDSGNDGSALLSG